MLICVPEVFAAEEVAEVRRQLDAADWEDGSRTAGHQSVRVKHNEQLPVGSETARAVGARILQALGRNPLFMTSALPLEVLPPMFNRYGVGQTFGTHVDNAIRQIPGSGKQIRTDLSATLFFSEPDEYDGGELWIEDRYGTQRVKLPAGHMVLYPSTSLHRVTPVTRGVRVSSFFWIQSMIRSDEQRSILLDLDLAIQGLQAECGGQEEVGKRLVALTGVYHNLLRQWAEM